MKAMGEIYDWLLYIKSLVSGIIILVSKWIDFYCENFLKSHAGRKDSVTM